LQNCYSAINFKDIMLATGRISAETITTDRIEQECMIGFEFAGLDPKYLRFQSNTTRFYDNLLKGGAESWE
jgi:hypothetical protein